MPIHRKSARPALLGILAAAAIAACDRAPEQQQTVTVYSSRSHYGAESVFVAFTLASLVVPPVVWWYFRPVLDDDGVTG